VKYLCLITILLAPAVSRADAQKKDFLNEKGSDRNIKKEVLLNDKLFYKTDRSILLAVKSDRESVSNVHRGQRLKNSSSLTAVRTFADNVLHYGRDVYGPEHTPLFADGIHIDTHEPAIWKLSNKHAEAWNMPREWILSNLASQQNLFRVLTLLSRLTGEPKYKQEAMAATRYAFDHLRHESGLLFWGGHAAWDLASDQPVGESRSGKIAGKHELKSTFPYYELMWEVDREVTKRFIEAFWCNHILQWDILDMNRHGPYKPYFEKVWDKDYVGGPLPFVGKGLTFINTGSDLYYAGAILYQLTGDQHPLLWAKRLAKRYADVRHPQTGLGADNYSVVESHRIQKQFEPELGDRITEASITSLYGNRYTRAAICQMKMYERLGKAGAEFKQWAIEDLTAYANHAYDPTGNHFWATINDGTKLSPSDRKRDGYVTTRWLEKRPANGMHLWAYALAYKLTGDKLMWRMIRNIGLGIELGDLGTAPGESMKIKINTSNTDVYTIFALLELYEATRLDDYLAVAQQVGDNVLAKEFHKGFFITDKDHVLCKFDTITPLALLYLEVYSNNLSIQLPQYAAGKSYFHCSYDGVGRTYDHRIIYTRLRESSPTANSIR